MTVRWEPPPLEAQNGPITGYKIRYRKQKNKNVQVETTPANVRRYEIQNLDRMGAYQVKIAAMTVNGTGPFSEWYHIETYENDLLETHVPGEPSFLRSKKFVPFESTLLIKISFRFQLGLAPTASS